jgi:hypothetical protein
MVNDSTETGSGELEVAPNFGGITRNKDPSLTSRRNR